MTKDNESEGDAETAENNHDERKYSETEAEKHFYGESELSSDDGIRPFIGLDDQEQNADEEAESDADSGKESNWVESEKESVGDGGKCL